ncbi:sulfatase-like hydrolase/transferase [Pelagicoccus mobilis]|uniref:Sulfatase-like hydrolase/transferase n=1 Tax=Pelagicoccus mobilis TaxID=415221 RepID=A0A934RYI6_9BACT|nr:sulfatase-like hydrolase/transferase [Pelagicoccus mobilis]MBK1878936.1 sulfatase-like hydrolase/transferase [Pelagicoccus mobilis]
MKYPSLDSLRTWGALWALAILGPFVASVQADLGPKQPNIIFILTDDLGWGDLGVFYQNSRTEDKRHFTPELDRFAAQGMQLRQHYCPAPVCAPSRASLLSGRHQGHEPIRNSQFDKALADSHTLATTLKTAGYRTAAVGKYGLQGGVKHVYDLDSWTAYPTKRGFDEFFGYVMHIDGHLQYPAHEWPIGNNEMHQTKKHVYHNDRELHADLELCYTTDLFTAFAKNWIVEHKDANPEQPFFLYLAHSTPHAALQVPTGPYPKGGGLDGGVQWLGKPGKMINTAEGEIDSWIHPDYAGKNWSDVEKRFATMVRRIDSTIGDLVKTLQDLGIDENTLIVFSSDNGPHSESYIKDVNYDPDSFDSFGPFNGIKRDTLEGGIRMPTLARWPSEIPVGSISDRKSQFHDWMPTFVEAAGLAAPALSDGVSLLPSLSGKGKAQDSTVYIEYTQNQRTPNYAEFEERFRGRQRKEMQVVFVDGYKGLRYNIKSHTDDFEIYDLRNDPHESKDLNGSSEYFVELQQRMKDRVLQLRRPNPTAKRPYDGELVPGIDAKAYDSKVSWSVYEGEFPWVPQTVGLKPVKEGSSKAVDLKVRTRKNDVVIEYKGFVKVAESGNYEFTVDSDTGAILRLHDAVVVDNESVLDGERATSGEILLEAGVHPYTLTYQRGSEGKPRLEFGYEKL